MLETQVERHDLGPPSKGQKSPATVRSLRPYGLLSNRRYDIEDSKRDTWYSKLEHPPNLTLSFCLPDPAPSKFVGHQRGYRWRWNDDLLRGRSGFVV